MKTGDKSWIYHQTALKSFQDFHYFVLDGIDGIGKTTQLNLLENHFVKKGFKVFRTRSIGGSELSEGNEFRKFIFENNFSKETEEVLLSAAAWLNIQEVTENIREHAFPHKTSKPIVILQDRGVLSHVTYAQCRGFARGTALELHEKNIYASRLLRAKNIILMPLSIDVILERVKIRGDAGAFHEKYEQEEFQLKVLDRMIAELTRRGDYGIRSMGDFEVVKISALDQPLDVHNKVLECLNLK